MSNYDVILSPVITEKSTRLSESNQVVFRVALDATKPQSPRPVEALFKVKVKAVNTLRSKGKEKTFRGQPLIRERFQESHRDPGRGLPDRHHDGSLRDNMALKTLQTDDATRQRQLVLVDRSGLHKGGPVKPLTEGQKRPGRPQQYSAASRCAGRVAGTSSAIA